HYLVGLEQAVAKRERRLKVPLVVSAPNPAKTRDDRKWIKRYRSPGFARSFGKPRFHRQLKCVPRSRRRVIWIQFNRSKQLALGVIPGKVSTEHRLTQSAVSFRKRWIDGDCGGRRFVTRSSALVERQHRIDSQPVVILGDSRVRHRILWIDGYCLVITNNRFRKSVFVEPIPIRTPAQICFVSLGIVRAPFRQSR